MRFAYPCCVKCSVTNIKDSLIWSFAGFLPLVNIVISIDAGNPSVLLRRCFFEADIGKIGSEIKK